ncbi:hypothetical protein J6P59_00545 [bacterium]|nr:hypothetical protein [bacterium]MBO7611056.1 hypothetical protein [Elusimicrobiota bacterium]
MITKLRDILNTYTDSELEEMDLWVNSNDLIDKIIVEENSIDLITHDMRIKIEEE